mgnify:CR=1 FL=1
MTQKEMLSSELQLAKDQFDQGTLTKDELLFRLKVIIDEYSDDDNERED